VNVSEWVEHATTVLESAELFYGHGTDNPVDEAAWLVLHCINAPVDGGFSQWALAVSDQQAALIRETLGRRIDTRIPLAYILGSAWFCGLEFSVSPSVLVPRSPIAELIQEQFQPWLGAAEQGSEAISVLDLCTGSGCIAIAMAIFMPWIRVDAADISPVALEVARENVKKHAVEDRVQVYQSDLFGNLNKPDYHLIVSNPPYVSRASMIDLPREYHAEPELGLIAGEDGLDLCLQIMLQSPQHLCDKGILICEVGESDQNLVKLLPAVPFIWLEFSAGGSGVFVLSREELIKSEPVIKALIEERKNVT